MTIKTRTILGDVHLGKKFVTGVPLNRRGDREAMVWEQFMRSLMNCETDYHIQTGDLFNQFAVTEALLLATANAYVTAVTKNPKTQYILYRGNHDASRDTSLVASFDILAELLGPIPNVTVLREVTVIDDIGFIPWHPFKSANELAIELNHMVLDEGGHGAPLDCVFGHFDVESFGGSEFNLVPTKLLASVTKTIYTGHIHLPTEFERDGVKVVVVGSMQPYAHGEDPTTDWYETVSFEVVDQIISPEVFKNKNLRVIVKPGQIPPEIDCLSLLTKPWKEKIDQEENDMDVEFQEFDMHKLFTGCLTEAKVGQTISDKIMLKFEELRNV